MAVILDQFIFQHHVVFRHSKEVLTVQQWAERGFDSRPKKTNTPYIHLPSFVKMYEKPKDPDAEEFITSPIILAGKVQIEQT